MTIKQQKDLNKEPFYKYMDSKSKGRENVGLLLNGAGDLMTKELEKENVLSSPQSFLASPAFRIFGSGGRLHQGRLNLREGGPGQGHKNPGMQRELINVILRPLSNTFKGDGGDICFPSVPWSGLLKKFISRNHHKMSRPLNLQ